MNSVKMKVVGWDEETLSLIIKFAADDSSSNIDDVNALAYQPFSMFPDSSNNTETLVKKIAVSGISICNMQKIIDQAKQNTAKIEEMKNLVGQTFEYSVEELLSLE
jgi:hypothetical protein